MIRLVSDAVPNLRYFLDGLTPFSLISKSLEKMTTPVRERRPMTKGVDIMGVIIQFEERKDVWANNKQSKVQKFTFVDMEHIPIKVSLWNDILVGMGPALENAANNLSIVVAKRLAVRKFEGVSLSSKNISSFTIDPPIEAAANLKAWVTSLTEIDLQKLRNNESIEISKELLARGAMDVYTVSEINNVSQSGDYWVHGFLQLAVEHQKLFYIGCSKCHTRIEVEDVGIQYECNLCKEKVESALRPLVILSITDHTDTLKAMAIGENAESILQNSISKIEELVKSGTEYDLDSIRSDFSGKQYMMLIRRSRNDFNDGKRLPLLISYSEQQVNALTIQAKDNSHDPEVLGSPASTSDVSRDTKLPISPLKRLMNQISLDTDATSKRGMTYAPESEPSEANQTEEPSN